MQRLTATQEGTLAQPKVRVDGAGYVLAPRCKLGQRAKCDPIPGSGQKAIRESSFGGDNEFKNGSREGKQSFYLSSTRRAPGAGNNGAAAVSEAHRESFKSKTARKGHEESGVGDTNSFIYSRAFFPVFPNPCLSLSLLRSCFSLSLFVVASATTPCVSPSSLFFLASVSHVRPGARSAAACYCAGSSSTA